MASSPARFEAGTGNIADAVGLGAALDYLLQIRLDEGLLDEGEVLQRLEDWWQERSGSRPR